jgi:hypothetical protein
MHAGDTLQLLVQRVEDVLTRGPLRQLPGPVSRNIQENGCHLVHLGALIRSGSIVRNKRHRFHLYPIKEHFILKGLYVHEW